jgi:methylenetetrahydrofolate dehydrogenase (NADP+)/methenyltetrahydrofolate cyclohydrolase
MTEARLLDGKTTARSVEASVIQRMDLLAKRGIRPGLTVVRVGNDPASEIYVRNKAKKAEELGIRGREVHFDETLTEEELLGIIEGLNRDDEVDGILVQLPLPPQIDARKVIEAIDPARDVDCFHPENVGRLHLGRPTLLPCTPAGVIRLLDTAGIELKGLGAVVVGRSDIVGKPLAALLLQRDATVTICHSRTLGLADFCRRADLLVAAVGRPHLIDGSMIREGAVVVDVGMNRLNPGSDSEAMMQGNPRKLELLRAGKPVIVGDIDFQSASERASWITPVPGGVGPMTIVMLMENTVKAAEARR